MRKNVFTFATLLALLAFTGCCRKPATEPSSSLCIEGVVIAQRGDVVGGLPACTSVVQITNRNIGVSWLGNNNCVFIFNLPASLSTKNTRVFFRSYTQIPSPLFTTDCTLPPAEFTINAEGLSTQCDQTNQSPQ
ncbi:MAG: hypothetical protein MUC49_06230 [Raineya sp.]|jgi:hypothetical protein|nr:hypothetical protein [Raineya sp.]